MCASQEDQHKAGLQYREDLSENYARMRYSAIQKMFDVKRTMTEVGKTGTATVERVVSFYAGLMWSSATGESITKEDYHSTDRSRSRDRSSRKRRKT